MNLTKAIDRANSFKSNLTVQDINHLDGLSAPKVWHLLNNLVAQSKSYLEVGCFKGSTLSAALRGNNVDAYAVDNFCMDTKSRSEFFENTKDYRFTFFEQDSWTV